MLDNRKSFFDSFAKEHGIDPLVPDNWYSILTQKNFTKVGTFYM